jgi:hypothetical protein
MTVNKCWVVIKKKDQTPDGYEAGLVLRIHTCGSEKIEDLILIYNHGSQNIRGKKSNSHKTTSSLPFLL